MTKIIAALIAAFLLFAAGCEDLDTGTKGTAADRAEVNQKGKAKDKPAKEDSGPQETTAQENARESAEMYLNTSSFSRSGLIQQLKFEGFSEKDATYGVDAQHANWNEQAAASAETYLDTSSFSRSGLIQQLKFEGFTEQQATYAANQVGL